MKNILLIVTIPTVLYALKVSVVVDTIDAAIIYWNYATIYITTFKDRHPYIMLFSPYMAMILLLTFKDIPDA